MLCSWVQPGWRRALCSWESCEHMGTVSLDPWAAETPGSFLCLYSHLSTVPPDFFLLKVSEALTHSWCLPAHVSGCLLEAHQGEQRRTWRWGRGAGSGSGCGAARAHGPWGIILLTETFPSCWPQALSSPNGSLIGPMMHLSGSTHFLTLRFPAAPSPAWALLVPQHRGHDRATRSE